MSYSASILMLRTLVEISSVGSICVNTDREIVYANESAEKIFGYIRDELDGVLIDRLIPDTIKEQHLIYMEQYFSNPETKVMGKGRQIIGRRRSGEDVKVKITLERPFAEGGKRYFTISVLIDET